MDKSSIEIRLAKVSVATWISTVITIGIQLLSVPICLHFWGREAYGVWLAVFAAFTLLRTIDYGYTLYTGNKLNMLYHTNDKDFRTTLASAVWGVLFLGVIQIIFLVILYMTNRMGLLIGHQSNPYYNFEIFTGLFIMSVCWICSASYIGIVHRIMIPSGHLYQTIWMMMWLQVALFFALITAAILKFNILNTAILFACTQTVFYLLSAVYIKSLLPRYYPWWKNSKPKLGIKFIYLSAGQTFGCIMNQGGLSALIVLIAAMLGPAAVPAFTSLRTISNLWTTLIKSFTDPMLPEAVRFYSTKQWQKLISINHVHWLLMSAVVNFSILIIYPFIGFIFKMWTGNHLLFDRPLLSLLLATISLSGMGTLMGNFLVGINQLSYVVISTALRGGFVLSLGWILLPHLGTVGLGLAIFIAEILVLIITNIWFYKYVIKRIQGKFELKFYGCSWLASFAVIIFLLSECFNFKFSNLVYCLSLLTVISGTLCAWKQMDTPIKDRMRLFLTQLPVWRKKS